MIETLSPPPEGILFDYGNTLIPFGQREMDAEGEALVGLLVAALPGIDRDAIEATFTEVRLAMHRIRRETLRETHPADLLRAVTTELGGEFDDARAEAAMSAHLASFRDMVRAGPTTVATLEALRDRGLRMGLVSNFFHAEAIHASLDHLDLRRFLEGVVVSAEIGVVKPHPEIFLAGARAIGLEPADILFVGDNARLDIVGANAVGMRTALITEFLDGAYHFERPGEDRVDVTPDLVLETLGDLVREG